MVRATPRQLLQVMCLLRGHGVFQYQCMHYKLTETPMQLCYNNWVGHTRLLTERVCRFVRETAFVAVAAICTALQNLPELSQIAVELSEKLRDGLSDNWSQVISFTFLCTTFILQHVRRFVNASSVLLACERKQVWRIFAVLEAP